MELGSTTVNRSTWLMVVSLLPPREDATSAKVPIAVPGISRERVAMPSGVIVVFVMLIVDAFENAKVEPLRFAPVTVMDATVVPAKADFGVIEVIMGRGLT